MGIARVQSPAALAWNQGRLSSRRWQVARTFAGLAGAAWQSHLWLLGKAQTRRWAQLIGTFGTPYQPFTGLMTFRAEGIGTVPSININTKPVIDRAWTIARPKRTKVF